jgi:phosphatidylglycerophosphate synthase
MPLDLDEAFLRLPLVRKTGKLTIVHASFNPLDSSSWTNLQDCLENQFMWLPWNWVTNTRTLSDLPSCGRSLQTFSLPSWISKSEVVPAVTLQPKSGPLPKGIAVTSDETAGAAERLLVAGSGKLLDGVHTSFNRRLCRPFVRLLSHTPVTPNQVTLGGVLVSILSFLTFAHGTYWSYVAGALLFFIAGLFDEMDGMLARIKFADSPFGTWFEGIADGLSYLMLFGGITLGLHRQYGRWPLIAGAALLAGTLLALAMTSLGRKLATSPSRPNEYLGRFYQMLDKDSSNWVSRVVRRVEAFQRRGVLIHYVVIFTVLGGVPVLFSLATLGSHLAWTLSIYFNHRFFRRPLQIAAREGSSTIPEAI